MSLKCIEGQRLTAAEKTAIDYINNHRKQIINMTISDISEEAHVSTATISRAIRKCGLENMLDVRYLLLDQEVVQRKKVVDNILQNAYKECIETIERLDTDEILKLVECIKTARKIHLIALGVTRLTAQEFEFQLQCQRYNVYTHWDSEVLKRMDELVGPGDLVIVLTVTNSMPEIKVGARLAKKAEATVAICCCVERTELELYADIKLYGYSVPVVPKSAIGCNSRIPLQIMIRTIMEYISL